MAVGAATEDVVRAGARARIRAIVRAPETAPAPMITMTMTIPARRTAMVAMNHPPF